MGFGISKRTVIELGREEKIIMIFESINHLLENEEVKQISICDGHVLISKDENRRHCEKTDTSLLEEEVNKIIKFLLHMSKEKFCKNNPIITGNMLEHDYNIVFPPISSDREIINFIRK